MRFVDRRLGTGQTVDALFASPGDTIDIARKYLDANPTLAIRTFLFQGERCYAPTASHKIPSDAEGIEIGYWCVVEPFLSGEMKLLTIGEIELYLNEHVNKVSVGA